LQSTLGMTTTQCPKRFAQQMTQRIEARCARIDHHTSALVEATLSDFGGFLLFEGAKPKCAALNDQALTLLKHLYQADSDRRFLQRILEIREFCGTRA
jgi:hypothetical protein